MKKRLVSVAVAVAVSVPAAAWADAVLYGKAHVTLDFFKIGDTGYKGWALDRGKVGKGMERGNRIGIKGSEGLGNGLQAIYQVEFGIPLANMNKGIADGDKGGIKMRPTYVGLSSDDFGVLLVGRHGTPIKISTNPLELFDDTIADYKGTLDFDDIRADSIILYKSPDYSGFKFLGAAMPGGGYAGGGKENPGSDDLGEGYSVASIYSNGPWFASLAYESWSSEFGAEYRDEVVAGKKRTLVFPGEEDYTKWRGGLGIRDWRGFRLSGIFEGWKGKDFKENKDAALWQFQFGYEFGRNMVKMMYGEKDWDWDKYADKASWALGVDHAFSRRTKAYLLYTEVDVNEFKAAKGNENPYEMKGNEDWNAFSIGVIHNF